MNNQLGILRIWDVFILVLGEHFLKGFNDFIVDFIYIGRIGLIALDHINGGTN